MEINSKQFAAVLGLAAPQRYDHFIKVAADQHQVWGLFRDGWALAATADGVEAFPLWPAREYAAACAAGAWGGLTAREIDLDELLDVLLPKLRTGGTQLAVFPTPSDKGITLSIAQLERDLRTELSRIE